MSVKRPMAPESITHLKLFVDQDEPQVALFSGDDQQRDWVRNEAAEKVLTSGWEQLPKENLITLADVRAQGLLSSDFLSSDKPNQTEVIEAWIMRRAKLASRLADASTATGDQSADAEQSRRVADYLEDLMASCNDRQRQQEISQQRNAYLLRAVECRLALWNNTQNPEQAEALAYLFAALSDPSWPSGTIDQSAARSNKVFWRDQALRAWGNASQSAEEHSEIEQAEHCCCKVLQLLQDQELNV